MNVPACRSIRRLLLPVVIAAVPAVRAADPVEAVGKAAGEWVKMRAETARLENEWETERTLLAATVNALKERATKLEEQRAHAEESTAAERAELAGLAAKNKAAAGDLKSVEARLAAVSERLLALRPSLPPRLSDALEMSFRSLAGTAAGPGERMQLVMTVLNRCAQFNASIGSGDEVLTLEGEANPKSVEVIYWGLSHGYAFDRATGRAWIGGPGAERWEWRLRPEAAAAVGELLAIHRDRADPAFVAVPAQLRNNVPGHSAR